MAISQEFQAALALTGAGNVSAQCSCGRMHYARKGWEELVSEDVTDTTLEDASKNPRCIINETDDSIGIYLIGGATYIPDCPCQGLEKIEAFLWNQRELIRRFYKEKKTQLLREAADLMRESDDIDG